MCFIAFLSMFIDLYWAFQAAFVYCAGSMENLVTHLSELISLSHCSILHATSNLFCNFYHSNETYFINLHASKFTSLNQYDILLPCKLDIVHANALPKLWLFYQWLVSCNSDILVMHSLYSMTRSMVFFHAHGTQSLLLQSFSCTWCTRNNLCAIVFPMLERNSKKYCCKNWFFKNWIEIK